MSIAVLLILLALFVVVVGGAIFVWIVVENSREPKVQRKWTDPKLKE
jgi:hypothetical protein